MDLEQEVDLSQVAHSICASEGFTLQEEVGGGAFKKVFRIEGSDGNVYALKVIHGSVSSPRTAREVQAMRRCDHPNIARLIHLDAHTFDGHRYDFLLEEYLAGGTLTERVKREGLLSDEATQTLGERLVDTLSHLAGLQLVHRDIKPDNIMYREDGTTPVLSDFGLVRDLAASSLTPTWAVPGPGTPYFAAPEQLNNQKTLIDWRTDQFSLGIVLSFVRFGRHPYQYSHEPLYSSPTVERVALRHPRCPQFFASIRDSGFVCLEKMTEPWPVQRFRTPEDLWLAWRGQRGVK
jgi:serine/threonine protein kinase